MESLRGPGFLKERDGALFENARSDAAKNIVL
jgi:hypothetical protein